MSKKDIFLENRTKALWAAFVSSCGHLHEVDHIAPMVTELEAIMRSLSVYHGLRIPRVGSLLQEARRRMGFKGNKYQLPNDRWANFHAAVELNGGDVYEALIGFALKHAGDILKMTKNMDIPVTRKDLWEKVGDWATYTLIAAEMAREELDEELEVPARLTAEDCLDKELDDCLDGELVEE